MKYERMELIKLGFSDLQIKIILHIADASKCGYISKEDLAAFCETTVACVYANISLIRKLALKNKIPMTIVTLPRRGFYIKELSC